MESLNRVFDTIEGNSRRKTELVGNLLLQELEEIYKIPFMTQMNSSVAQIISLLNERENNQIKETVIKLLEKWMNLADIILSEVIQSKKKKTYMICTH